MNPSRLGPAATLLLALGVCQPVLAQGADIDQVRAATAKLIAQLVEQGILSRDKGEALLTEVGKPAASGAAPATAGKAATPTVSALGGAVLLACIVAALHTFYMPIDVAWFGILRRLGA